MDDKQIVNFINQAKKVDMPAFLSDTDTQRFIYAADANGMPKVVDTKAFNSIIGTKIYRTVNDFYDDDTDVGMKSGQIAQQTMRGSLSRIGGGYYGDGYYFSNSLSGSKSYGIGRGRSTYMTAKINSNAKVVSFSSLSNMFSRESQSVQNAFNNMTSAKYDGKMGAYALWKGCNVIVNGGSISNGTVSGHDTYVNVLDRSVLTFSKKTNRF